MATPFDSISLKIASPDEIKALAKRTCCKRRSSTVNPGAPFSCPEMHTCNCGEVKKAETINYRSFRPELEGLFCEAIFGPSKDWECNCGKYKRIKHKGVICDRCGVEVTRQHVRRERMGYIQLASPVSHIWFFKGAPSRIGAFCDFSARQIENILYFDAFLVTEADEELQAQGILKPNQLISEAEFDTYKVQYRGRFKAGAGGEILAKHLASLDLEAECEQLAKELEETRSHQKKVKLAKQLRMREDFLRSGQRPEWMIIDVLPVIPPDLRPLVTLDGGRFATSDLNDLYRRLIHRNNRLAKLIQMRSPEVILRNEKRMLQEAVDAFFDNGRHGRSVTGPGNRELKSLSHVLKGKVGRFRQNLLGKRVDYSGRSVIVVGPELALHQCGIPKQMAVELFKPFIIERLQAYGYSSTIKRAKSYVENIDSGSPVWDVLEEVIEEHPVLLNRPPTLHRLGIQAFMPVLVEGKSIRIPPLVCKAFNADFDGDQMAVHVPLTAEAQAEAKLLMLSSHNILKPSHGGPIAVPELDMVLGPSYLTKTLPEHDADAQLLHKVYTHQNSDTSLFDEIRRKPWYHRRYAHPEEVVAAHGAGQLKLHDSVQLFFPENGRQREPILTTVGRVIFNEVLPAELDWEDEHSGQQLPFFNGEAGGRQLSTIVEDCFNTPALGTRATVELLQRLQKLAFEYATQSGISPSINDYIKPPQRQELLEKTEQTIAELIAASAAGADTEELENEQIHLWFQALREMENIMFSTLPELETRLVDRDEDVKGFSPVHIMADSGARARKNPFMQISAVLGLKAKQSGEILLPPITTSYRDGLDVIDYFNSTYGSRKGLVDTAMKTAASGYLTRKLVDVAQDVRVTETDCGTLHGIKKFSTEGGELAFKIRGRTAPEDILHPNTGEVLVKADELISAEAAALIEKSEAKIVTVRSMLTCETEEGVCAKCYGHDLTTNRLVSVGEAVGIIAAQSIGEPGTQLTMRTFHTGGFVEDVAEGRESVILPKARSGVVRYRDFHPGITVRQAADGWIATSPTEDLDRPTLEVIRIFHPECQLAVGDQLTAKKFDENIHRYKGFETRAWRYKVTAITDSECDLNVGDLLTLGQLNRAKDFERFATKKRKIVRVLNSTVDVRPGDLLTEETVEKLKADIRNRFDGEWRYQAPETEKAFKSLEELVAAVKGNLSEDALADISEDEINLEDLGDTEVQESPPSSVIPHDTKAEGFSVTKEIPFERVYLITKRATDNFPYAVGEVVEAEKIAPWLTPFEEEPIYVIDDNAPKHAGEIITQPQYKAECDNYKPFEVEKQRTVLHHVTEVYRPDLKLPQGASQGEPETTFTKEVCEFLKTHNHQVSTQVAFEVTDPGYCVDLALEAEEPGHYFLAIECNRVGVTAKDKSHQRDLEAAGCKFHHISLTEWQENSDEAKAKLLVAVAEASDRPLKGKNFTKEELEAKHNRWPGFETLRLRHRVIYVDHPDCPLTQDELLTDRKKEQELKRFPGIETRDWRVTAVHHPGCPLKPEELLSDAKTQRLLEEYPGIEAILAVPEAAPPETEPPYQVTAVHHPNCTRKVGTLLTEKALTALRRQFKGFDIARYHDWRVTDDIYHPDCSLKSGALLSEDEFQEALKKYPGIEATRADSKADTVEVERLSRVTTVHHRDCSLEVGELLTSKEATALRRKFKGVDAETYYDVAAQGRFVSRRLSEQAYKTEKKRDSTLADRAILQCRIVNVQHPNLTAEVGTELTKKELQKFQRDFKGFDVETVYRVINDPREEDTRFDDGELLSQKDYRAYQKENRRVTYTVTAVHHPDCPHAEGDELPEKDYEKVVSQYPGFEVEEFHLLTAVHNPNCPYKIGDELSKKDYENAVAQYTGFQVDDPTPRMHIVVHTDTGRREEHHIPAGYFFNIKKGAKVDQAIPAGHSFNIEEGAKVDQENSADSSWANEQANLQRSPVGPSSIAAHHESSKNSDIVAGIPRVTDLFEARRPKRDEAEIAEIEGRIESAGSKSGVPTYRIVHEGHESRLYAIPDEKRRVTEGDWVEAGQPLTDGYLNPHDILKIGRVFIEDVPIEGEEAIWTYLIEEIQKVYGARAINDKHLEAIVRQMMRKVRVLKPGDTQFPHNSEVTRQKFAEVNAKVIDSGGEPATGESILQGISRASLSTESFISAASFQQTTKVLTDAAVKGQTDKLSGLKENVILGRLIPAGSGLPDLQHLEITEVDTDEEMEAPEPAE